MHKKQTKGYGVITWKQYFHKGYSAFASLRRQVKIGVLAVSTLSTVTPVQAETERMTDKAFEGDERTLEEIQVAGTMAPLTQLQSARIVSVLTRKEIEQAGVQSTNDLLKLASGVDVRQRGGFGIQTDISIDGGTFDQITLLLNGIPLSSPHTGHLSADIPISLSDIEHVEILSGASSRVYGGSSFGGCINIVTRNPFPKAHDGEGETSNDRERKASPTYAAEAGAEGGSHGTIQGDVRLALGLKTVGNSLSASGGRSNGGTTNSDWKRAQAYYQGNYGHQQFDLRWQFGFSKKNYGANTFYSAAYPDQYERNERYTMSIGGETKGKFRFTPTLWWNRTYDNFELVRGERFGENFHQVDVYGLRLGGHINWQLGKTAIGTEIRNEGILSTNLGKLLEANEFVRVHGDKTIFYDHKENRTNISYNVEHNVLLPHWTLSAGVIVNMNTAIDHRFRLYPGADIAYRPNSKWKIYASYSKGFRLPTFTDLYYKSPTLNGNTGLRPEENRSMQLGARYSKNGLQTTLRGFYHRGHNLIDWVMFTPTDIYHSTSFNLDNMGVQMEAKADFTQFCKKKIFIRTLSVGYTYIYQHRRDHQEIFRSSYALEYLRHTLTATLHHQIVSKLTATWSLRWQDRMGGYILYEGTYTDPTTGYLRGTSTSSLVPYHPYATLDLKLQWADRKYSIYVQGTNITNRRYYDLGNIPQPGIWVLAGVRFRI